MVNRLLVHAEGHTEESFVNNVLRPHLVEKHGFHSVSARLLGKSRQRTQRGGIRSWPLVRKDIIRCLNEDPDSIITTMVDYYGLPQDGEKSWPRRKEASSLPFPQNARLVQEAMGSSVRGNMGGGFDPRRFVPYVMMHEFEALLFSDCPSFAEAIGKPDLAKSFEKIRKAFPTPEEINNSPEQAPSKRISALFKEYQKPLFGTKAVQEIGLGKICDECPHFAAWLDQLIAL